MGCTNVSFLVVTSRCGYGRKRVKAIVHLSVVPLTTAWDSTTISELRGTKANTDSPLLLLLSLLVFLILPFPSLVSPKLGTPAPSLNATPSLPPFGITSQESRFLPPQCLLYVPPLTSMTFTLCSPVIAAASYYPALPPISPPLRRVLRMLPNQAP